MCEKTIRRSAALLYAAAIWITSMLASCNIDSSLETCRYNVQINYRYFREISDSRSMLESYIHTIDEFLFDQDGLLLDKHRVQGSACSGKNVSESTVAPGRYRMVAIGNLGSASRMPAVEPGVTRIEELFLYLDNHDPATGSYGDAERLYYGYGTFTVRDREICRMKVNMFHAHCVLDITVKWKTPVPDDMRDLSMVYKEVPGQYAFRPEHVIKDNGWHDYDPSFDDYPLISPGDKSYTPGYDQAAKMVVHRKNVNINVDRKIITQFITYRYRSDSDLMISLFAGQRQIMKEIDLRRFFDAMGVDLDKNYRQEFSLQFEIDGDYVRVGFVSLSDWEEGGVIGRR